MSDAPKTNCGSCKFFVLRELTSGGNCYRYPPKITFGPFYYASDSDWNQDRPFMTEDEWCGEWRGRDYQRGQEAKEPDVVE